MAQINFPYLVSLDWVQLSLAASNELFVIESVGNFICSARERGSRQFKSIIDVSYVTADAELIPFGVFCCDPTLESWSRKICSLKLDNSLLYNNVDGGWYNILCQFLSIYDLTISHLQRCDIACDFIYLKNRVSGTMLAKNIKSMKWWKCGSVNISEHYTMPYSLKWVRDIATDGYETEIYLQNGELSPRVESMTFGKISSGAQVILYDKSLELKSHEFSLADSDVKICSKEYIRSAWKDAGVYDEKRHTWRIEIRLSSSALFMRDFINDTDRRLTLADIIGDNLKYTFFMAMDRYFRLVDFTEGGKYNVDIRRCVAMSSHKNRLPKVELFDTCDFNCKLCRAKYHIPCNQFNRSVVNRLQSLAMSLTQEGGCFSRKGDKEAIKVGMESLRNISENIGPINQKTSECVRLLKAICFDANMSDAINPADVDNIVRCRKVLERRLRTESPRFLRMMMNDISRVKYKVDVINESAMIKGKDIFVKPKDSAILTDSVKVLQSLYSPVLRDQQAEDNNNIYYTCLTDLLNKMDNNYFVSKAEYDFMKFCLSTESPLGQANLRAIKDFYYNSVLHSVEVSKDYNQFLHFNKMCDADYIS